MSVSGACVQLCVGCGSRSECLNKVQTLVVIGVGDCVPCCFFGLCFLDMPCVLCFFAEFVP